MESPSRDIGFPEETERSPKERNQKQPRNSLDINSVCLNGTQAVSYCALRGKKTKKVEELAHGWWVNGTSCQHVQVLTTNLLQKMGMARREEPRDETWDSGKTNDVHGKLGHKNCLLLNETEACG